MAPHLLPEDEAETGPPPRLAPGQLHELHAEADGWAAALLFALSQAAPRPAPLLLARMRAPARSMPLTLPCAEGWSVAGIDPTRLLIVHAPDALALLRAAHEGARCPALGAVVLETWGPLRDYDLVASRRLVLAAEASGVPVIILRGDGPPRPSAAHTRWHIRPAPSRPLLLTGPAQELASRLPGPATITVDLLRQRGGPAGQTWQLEWNEDHGHFFPLPAARPDTGAAVAGPVVSLSALRKDRAGRRNAA